MVEPRLDIRIGQALVELDLVPPMEAVEQSLLSADRLRELVLYDPASGLFAWRVRVAQHVRVGDIAGWLDHSGYSSIMIDGNNYKAHRLAFLYMTGDWPKNDVDHKNNNRADNRWTNLREATRTQNNANSKRRSDNKSDLKGVSFHKASGKFLAQIGKDGKNIYLGLFNTPEEAHAAYIAAAEVLFGEYARAEFAFRLAA